MTLCQFQQNFVDIYSLKNVIAQSAGAVEYTDYISTERQDNTHKCPGYHTKQSEG